MPRSMLIYQEVPETPTGPATLIGLHASGGDLDQLVPLAREIGSFQLIAPQAARPISPVTQGYPIPSDGFTWFFIQEIGRPEPATFGESLWLLEQFVYDVRDRQGAGQQVFLLGYEQGGVLSATLAGIVPESLSGVVSLCGYLPKIHGWSPPVEDLDGLPVLLVHDPSSAEIPRALVEETVTELGRRGAEVQEHWVNGSRRNPLAAAGVVKRWLDLHVTGPEPAERIDSLE